MCDNCEFNSTKHLDKSYCAVFDRNALFDKECEIKDVDEIMYELLMIKNILFKEIDFKIKPIYQYSFKGGSPKIEVSITSKDDSISIIYVYFPDFKQMLYSIVTNHGKSKHTDADSISDLIVYYKRQVENGFSPVTLSFSDAYPMLLRATSMRDVW